VVGFDEALQRGLRADVGDAEEVQLHGNEIQGFFKKITQLLIQITKALGFFTHLDLHKMFRSSQLGPLRCFCRFLETTLAQRKSDAEINNENLQF
jgi:hypothetical protein